MISRATDVNSALSDWKTYSSAGGSFVDVTTATGAYGSFGTVPTKQYGRIPDPVEPHHEPMVEEFLKGSVE